MSQSPRVVIKRKPSRQNSNSPKKQLAPPSREGRTTASETEDVGDTDFDEISLHSDALDNDSDPGTRHAPTNRKRKRLISIEPRGVKGRKTRNRAHSDEDEGEGLKVGQELVGKVVQAPKTGRGTYRLYIRGPRV